MLVPVKRLQLIALRTDNTLFEAVRDAETALDVTVEDWIELYQAAGDDEDARGQPLADFVNFAIRVRCVPVLLCACMLTRVLSAADAMPASINMKPSISTERPAS